MIFKIKNEDAVNIDWAEYQYVGEDAEFTYYELRPAGDPYVMYG